ncbi:MAG: DUF4328 domain-containing protein [Actinomycetota bacterium]
MNNPLKVPPFVSGHSISKVVMLLLVLSLLVSAYGVIMQYSLAGTLSQLNPGKAVPQKDINSHAEKTQIFNMVSLPVALLTAVFFLVWIHRVYRNLRALGARGLKYSSGMAVVNFIIPLIQLYRPFFVMRDIWKASDPGVDPGDGYGWKKAHGSFMINFWWLCFAVGLFINYAYLVLLFVFISKIEAGVFLNMTYAIMFSHVLGILATVMLILMVRSIDHRQDDKSSHMAIAGAPPGGVTLKGAGA